MIRSGLHWIIGLMGLFLISHPIGAQNGDHPEFDEYDTLNIVQLDGTKLTVIGFGRFYIAYNETIDGYTVVRNDRGVFEYAEIASNGDLVSSGVIAHNPGNRDEEEKGFLENQPKHLRYEPPKLNELKEKQNRFFNLEKYAPDR